MDIKQQPRIRTTLRDFYDLVHFTTWPTLHTDPAQALQSTLQNNEITDAPLSINRKKRVTIQLGL